MAFQYPDNIIYTRNFYQYLFINYRVAIGIAKPNETLYLMPQRYNVRITNATRNRPLVIHM